MTTKPTERDLIEEAEALLADFPRRRLMPLSDWEIERVRRLVAEVKRLRRRVKTMERDAREDAQAAANEARWQERQGEDYGSY